MRHNRRSPTFLIACMAVLGIAGCESDKDLAVLVGTKADASRVPLVRPLPLVDMAEPMVVEFELPPHGPNATPTLSIGLRVDKGDEASAFDAASKIERADVRAKVRLARIDSAMPAEMALVRRMRNEPAAAALVPVVDGDVVGVWPDGTDRVALLEAGLSSLEDERRERAMAWMENSQPGRYRLSVQLIDPDKALEGLKTELLVGYVGKSK